MSEPLAPTVVLAPSGPALPDRTAAWLSMAEPDQDVVDTVAAVNELVRAWIPVPADGQPWPQRVVRGCTMLAGRLYRRRNSPGGVEVFGAEGAAYVSRSDPDVAQLLRIGPYAEPWVG